MSIIGIIPARSGSKGIPNKNIALLNSKPLIAYTIETAKRSKIFDEIILSTDSPEIAKISEDYGVRVPVMRSKELAQDTTPTFPVIKHLIKWFETKRNKQFDFIMLLQPTAPLRSEQDIISAYKLLIKKTKIADSLVSVCKVDEPHPVKMKKICNGYVRPFLEYIEPTQTYRRQDCPTVYFLNGAIYLCRTKELLDRKSLLGSKTLPYVMPLERSVNIDSELDLKIAEVILKQNERDK